MCTQTVNPWEILAYFNQMIFSVIVSSAVVLELFVGISCFFFALRMFQLAEAKGGLLTFKDVCKAWGRKCLRIVPIYWAVFFIGWGLFPRISTGPIWYKGALMYETCDQYWWAQLLMIGNIYPWFTVCNEGCFYWGWIVDIDIQLALLVPIFVFAYLKGKWVGHICSFIAHLGAMAIGLSVVYKYDLKAGILAEQNWNLYAYLLEKPWCHASSMLAGVYFSQLYMRLVKYRLTRDAESYPGIHRACTQSWIRIAIALMGGAIIITDLTIGRSAIASPYSWNTAQNLVYYGLTRWTYVIGGFLIAFSIFFSPN